MLLFTFGVPLALCLLAMFGVINLFVLAVEEPRLSKNFGGTYKRYRKSVRRWIPRLTPYREKDSVSSLPADELKGCN